MKEKPIKQLTYPISPDYVRKWTIERAISELVANAIDVDPDFSFEYSDGQLTIEDAGPGIPESGLVLGLSTKGRKEIGQFGEGKKIAALVLARSRKIKRVRFETVGYAFEPRLTTGAILGDIVPGKKSEGLKMLQYDFYPCDRAVGTKITIECDQRVADAVRERFLYFAPDYQPPQDPGRIVPDQAGKVYIGGVLVQENKELAFSYDLALEAAKHLQNRDRTEISGYQLERICAQVRSATEDEQFLERWTRLALDNKLSQSEAECSFSPRQIKTLRRLKDKLLGKGEFCYSIGGYEDSEASLSLNDEGYTILQAPDRIGSTYFHRLMQALEVPSCLELVKQPASRKIPKTRWIKLDKLDDTERDNLSEAVRIVRGLWGADAVGEHGVYLSHALDDGHDDSLGFYQPRNGKIGIRKSTLADFEQTVSTLLHEAAHRLRHKECGWDYQDRTRGFEGRLQAMAASAALRLHKLGAIPDVASIAEQSAEADKNNLPLQTARLVKGQMKTAGIKSAKALAADSGIHIGSARAIAAGKAVNSKRRVEAAAEVLGLDGAVLYCLTQAERLGYVSRNRSGHLYGATYPKLSEAVKELEQLGGEYAKIAPRIQDFADTEPNEEVDWEQPFRELLAAQQAKLAGD